MKPGKLLSWMLFSALVVGSGCGPGGYARVNPYESCAYGDYCNGGLTCAQTTLPASSGYTGSFCTAGCNFSSDCPQLISNYDAICVNQQCYLQCPTGSNTCPYGQGCFIFDSNVGPISLCTP